MLIVITFLQATTINQGSTNCGILLSQMGEHDVGFQYMENMGNMDNMVEMENINEMTFYDSKHFNYD